jgi:hypothetical protein
MTKIQKLDSSRASRKGKVRQQQARAMARLFRVWAK